MKIFFLGTPDFAVPPLKALASLAGHSVCGVITNPDQPSGRQLKLKPPPVKTAALELGIPVYQPEKFNTAETLDILKASGADLLAVVAYGKIIGDKILAEFKDRVINLHPSLLPKYRGVAPYQWALVNGETLTGVSIIYLIKQLDAGDIILQQKYEIKAEDNAKTLHDTLCFMGADLLCKAAEAIADNKVTRAAQDESNATYYKKIDKTMGKIDWSLCAEKISNLVRGLYFWPSAYTFINSDMIKIHEACPAPEYANHNSACGTLICACEKSGLIIACGENTALRIKTLQLASRNIQSCDSFLRGNKISRNIILN
jgi:methionyl-tRNA formyltransferase